MQATAIARQVATETSGRPRVLRFAWRAETGARSVLLPQENARRVRRGLVSSIPQIPAPLATADRVRQARTTPQIATLPALRVPVASTRREGASRALIVPRAKPMATVIQALHA